MRTRYQNGNLERQSRANGPDVWLYRWRERVNGKSTRKGVIVGTVNQYPTEARALRAADKLRIAANETIPLEQTGTFGALIDRYIAEEMPKRFSTQAAYRSLISNHIRPKWNETPLDQVRAHGVRTWLRGLPLAPKTKGHLRSIMSKLFDCAMLWELIEIGRNPMELVEIKGVSKREEEPRVLTVDEFHVLLQEVEDEPFRTMLLIAICLGLRCSELLALKWSDLDWDNLTVLVQRAIVAGHVDEVKTKYSKTRVPLDAALAEVLLNWRRRSPYTQETDWMFASPYRGGTMPYRPWGVQQRYIRPAAVRAKLGNVGWHTFRHTYRSWLDETGAPMKVQQELMRHASIATTMNIYGAAMSDTKRTANSKVVAMAIRA